MSADGSSKMVYDDETKYWQKEYRDNKSNPMFDDMPGEIRVLLEADGKFPGTENDIYSRSFMVGIAIAIVIHAGLMCLY